MFVVVVIIIVFPSCGASKGLGLQGSAPRGVG